MLSAQDDHFYYWANEIPEDICNLIIKTGVNHDTFEARTLGATDERAAEQDKLNKKVRDSSVSWINTRWITGMLCSYVRMANEEMFKYHIKPAQDFSHVQFTTYDKDGHYDWHQDNASKAEGRIEMFRKLSLIVQLSDKKSYEGGAFEIKSVTGAALDVPENALSRGSVIVFPSYLEHRIAPVTSGVRHSLVGWYHGDPFK